MTSRPIVFFGSSDYSLPVLEKLIAQNLVSLVITTRDKPVGRHLKITPNPVKLLAIKNNLPVIEKFSELNTTPLPSPKLGGGIEEGGMIALVAAFGRIIPQEILDKFNGQIFSIHPSLLPKYRGPSPLQFQILDGLTETGVTIIQLDAEMDHGPIVAQETGVINDTDTPQTLGRRLFEQGTDLFINEVLLKIKNLPVRQAGLKLKIQDDSLATYTHKLTRQDGFIPYEEYCDYLKIKNQKLKIDLKLRAYWPWPGIWTLDPEGNRLKLSLTQL